MKLRFVCLSILFAGMLSGAAQSVPVAERGVLDLRDWDFAQGAVPLYGELGFRWQALLPPTEATEEYFTGYWAEGFPGSDYGYATYRLTLLLPPYTDSYGLNIGTLQTAYRLWINGQEKAGAGTVGTTRATTIPRHQPQSVTFHAPEGRAELVVQLANFHYPGASLSFAEGMHRITIATAAQIIDLRERQLVREGFFVGIFLIVAIYHLLVFAARVQDNLTALYFGVFCLTLALRDATNGQIIANYLVPSLPLEVLLSLDYAAAVSLGLWFLLYLAGLFPEFRGRWLQGFVAAYALFIAFILLTPARTFGATRLLLVSLGVVTLAYITIGTGRALLRRRESIYGVLAGVAIVVVTSLLELFSFVDITHISNNIGSLSSYGFIAFVLVQASLLARRNARAYERLEQVSYALEDSNNQLETRVAERTADLEAASQRIQTLNRRLHAENLRMGSELDVTRRLQRLLLPSRAELQAVAPLDIAAINLSASEVGGDYYDVLSLAAGTASEVVMGIGDVTGHGLESGMVMLMTQMGIRTLLEHAQYTPSTVLPILNRSLYKNIARMQADKSLTLALLHYQKAATGGSIRISGQHETLLVLRANGQLEHYDTLEWGFPLGLTADIDTFMSEQCLLLQPGDGVVLYTDGITEALSPTGEMYGVERLCERVQAAWQQPSEAVMNALLADLHQHIVPDASSVNFAEVTLEDDVTLLIFKQC